MKFHHCDTKVLSLFRVDLRDALDLIFMFNNCNSCYNSGEELFVESVLIYSGLIACPIAFSFPCEEVSSSEVGSRGGSVF